MADPVAALVEILKADIDVAALTGAFVFGGELPAAVTADMPRRAIVLRASGGSSLTANSFVEHDTQRIDLFAFGATPLDAGQLADLAALKFRRVQRIVSASTLVHWVKSAGGYSSGREPVTEWPRAFRSFQVFYALESVS